MTFQVFQDPYEPWDYTSHAIGPAWTFSLHTGMFEPSYNNMEYHYNATCNVPGILIVVDNLVFVGYVAVCEL